MLSPPSRRVLLVDDDNAIRKSINDYLCDQGHEIMEVSDGDKALIELARSTIDIVLLDLRMPGTNGFDILAHMEQNLPEIPVIVISGTGAIGDVIEALHLGAWDIVVKPIIEFDELEQAIQRASDRAERLRTRHLYQQSLENHIRERTQQLDTAKAKLEEQSSLQEVVFESLLSPLFYKDANKCYRACNSAFCAMAGFIQKDILEKTVHEIFSPEQARFFDAMDADVLQKNTAISQETNIVHPDGSLHHYLIRKNPMRRRNGDITGIVGIFYDITDRKRSEEHLRATLAEKDALLKEIHHRVKNNLQLVSSLLALQNEYAETSAKPLFLSCYNRIRSMALLHEELYSYEMLDRIHFSTYLEKLSLKLFGAYSDGRNIVRSLETDDVTLAINTAIPCGLLVTELVTNALRHAFPENSTGTVTIAIHKDENTIHLRIQDDGIGMPEDITVENATSLGLILVSGLIGQLHATLSIQRENGTTFDITFAEKKIYRNNLI
ncbi:sensor histidine kinase [Desulfovibrio inopinatus]|uniref:sensor histidine kinase n=1 Tax=Desulfovibrio inopinatus TaxID=102109 RepID=UPI0004092988|nr:response regulator [Desulfovibrio inopinatus]